MKEILVNPTLKQYLKYIKSNDLNDLGIADKEIANYRVFSSTDISKSYKPKKYIKINSNKYYVEGNPLKISYNRFVIYNQILNTLDDDTSEIQVANKIIACFLYPVKGWLNRKDVLLNDFIFDTISLDVLSLRLSDVYSLLLFFLRISNRYTLNMKEHYLKERTRMIYQSQD